MGKGSKRRPAKIPDSIIEENWNRIFSKDNEKKVLEGLDKMAKDATPNKVVEYHE